MPISTLADAKSILINRDINPVRVRDGWEVQGQVLTGKQLVQLARQLDGGDAPSKYGNTRVEYDGRTFHSIAEMEYYKTLRLQEAAGEISDLECQPRFELRPAFRDCHGVKHAPMFYFADFGFKERGRIVAVDIKGARTAVYLLKRDLFLFQYWHIDFREIEV
jgi:hypothetical protein